VQLITALKERLQELEKDNGGLADENEELRQFSLDGYEIARNVQQLALEREKLSVDLADKATTIRNLLD
jgi:predicted RNase H-like nuclease (RuvC/YqgF family)